MYHFGAGVLVLYQKMELYQGQRVCLHVYAIAEQTCHVFLWLCCRDRVTLHGAEGVQRQAHSTRAEMPDHFHLSLIRKFDLQESLMRARRSANAIRRYGFRPSPILRAVSFRPRLKYVAKSLCCRAFLLTYLLQSQTSAMRKSALC